MIIGIPKERKTLEKRVALTPAGAQKLIKQGHKVIVEKDAGKGSFFQDSDYLQVGCEISSTLREVWTSSELIVKVKEPHRSEYKYFRPDLAIFDYLHLSGLPNVAEAMLKGQVTGIAYEMVQTSKGRLPLLEPMSEVAGKLSVQVGSYFLLEQNGGRGVLLGGTTDVEPGKVVIVGAGCAGKAACTIAVGMGAKVTVLDINKDKLKHLKAVFKSKIKTCFSTEESLLQECAAADLLIGAVLVPGAKAPRVITREMIKAMPPRSVFVDISIDQGGSAETIRPTSLKEPIYIEEEVIHYAVPNMPAQTARTSTEALTSVTLPYIMIIANEGVKGALKKNKQIREALCTYHGKLTNQVIAESLGISFASLKEILSQ